jgi:hypothetical protein
MPEGAVICAKCGTIRRFAVLRYLGPSIPLILASLSIVALLYDRVRDALADPPRAEIVIRSAPVHGSLNLLTLDMGNLSDVTALLPLGIDCTPREAGLAAFAGTDAGIIEDLFIRTSDAPLALRNMAEPVTYVPNPDLWVMEGTEGLEGTLDCTAEPADHLGPLPAYAFPVAFHIGTGEVVLYTLDGVAGADDSANVARLLAATRDDLIGNSD